MACPIVVTRPFAQLGRTILDFLFLARLQSQVSKQYLIHLWQTQEGPRNEVA